MHTPWGHSQTQRLQADGIVFHSTASHGGYLLSQDRHEQLLRMFPWFETFAGGRWYEEDCDAAVVTLAFPNKYAADEIRTAALIVEASKGFSIKWGKMRAWLHNSPEGLAVLARVAVWEKENAGAWEPRGMGSPPKGYPRGS